VAEAGGRRWRRAVGCGWWPWLAVGGSGGHGGVAAVGGGCGWHRGAAAALRDMRAGRACGVHGVGYALFLVRLRWLLREDPSAWETLSVSCAAIDLKSTG